MQLEQNKALIRRWIAFADAGFHGAFDGFVAPDFVGHLGELRMELATFERLRRDIAGAFPDLRHAIDDLVAEGDRVVARVTFRGTHRGEFLGVRPTGRTFEFTGIFIYRVAFGKIAEGWAELDVPRFLRQILEGGDELDVPRLLRRIAERR